MSTSYFWIFPLINKEFSMSSNETHTWPELAIGLYEHLTGKNAEIIYTFENMTIGVPSSTGETAKTAPWHLDGTLRIHTRTHDGA